MDRTPLTRAVELWAQVKKHKVVAVLLLVISAYGLIDDAYGLAHLAQTIAFFLMSAPVFPLAIIAGLGYVFQDLWRPRLPAAVSWVASHSKSLVAHFGRATSGTEFQWDARSVILPPKDSAGRTNLGDQPVLAFDAAIPESIILPFRVPLGSINGGTWRLNVRVAANEASHGRCRFLAETQFRSDGEAVCDTFDGVAGSGTVEFDTTPYSRHVVSIELSPHRAPRAGDDGRIRLSRDAASPLDTVAVDVLVLMAWLQFRPQLARQAGTPQEEKPLAIEFDEEHSVNSPSTPQLRYVRIRVTNPSKKTRRNVMLRIREIDGLAEDQTEYRKLMGRPLQVSQRPNEEYHAPMSERPPDRVLFLHPGSWEIFEFIRLGEEAHFHVFHAAVDVRHVIEQSGQARQLVSLQRPAVLPAGRWRITLAAQADDLGESLATFEIDSVASIKQLGP